MESEMQSAWSKLMDKLYTWWDSIILSLPNFLLALIMFSLSYWIAKLLQAYLNRFLKRFIQQASIRTLISNIVSVLVIVLGFFMALGILNLDGTLKSLLTGAGVAGLAVSLALQGTLTNTFSGIFIAIKDELNIGDFIESNGFAGEVVEINLRNTKIREADNNLVVVPNKLILDKPFKNYGLTQEIRTTISCGVDYNANLDHVEAVAKASILEEFPDNSKDRIEFFFTRFGDSSIDFILRFWAKGKKNLRAIEVKSRAIKAIKKAFEKESISIPYPIRKVINNA